MAKPVFLAAPYANAGDLGLVDKLLVTLQVASQGDVSPRAVWVPHLDAGEPGVDVDAGAFFTRALSALNDARVVVAVLDGAKTDDGVAFAIGCAFAAGKPVIGYRTDRRQIADALVASAMGVVTGDVKELARLLREHLSA